MRYLQFIVPGLPIAQPRYQQSWGEDKRGKPKRVAYIRKTARGGEHPVIAYKQHVGYLAMEAVKEFDRVSRSMSVEPWSAYMARPMRLDVDYVMPRPAKLKKPERGWHIIKPDRDNAEKALKDSLKGLVWNDDSQVCDGRSRKIYASSSEMPHVVIRIEVIEELPE